MGGLSSGRDNDKTGINKFHAPLPTLVPIPLGACRRQPGNQALSFVGEKAVSRSLVGGVVWRWHLEPGGWNCIPPYPQHSLLRG